MAYNFGVVVSRFVIVSGRRRWYVLRTRAWWVGEGGLEFLGGLCGFGGFLFGLDGSGMFL